MPDRIQRRTLDLGLFLLAWLPYAWLVRRFWYLSDDAFISFRYARNWAEGLGLRFNLAADPPVEGYSNFLWVAVSALLELLGASPLLWAPLLSFACGSVLLWRVWRLLLGPFGEPDGPAHGRGVAFLALASLAWFPPFALWSSSGLETMPFALLFFLCFEGLFVEERPPGWALGSAGLGLALIRTEGVAWVGAMGALALLLQPARRRALLLRWLAPVLGAYAVYFGLRYAWFGHPLANTAVAKVGFSWPVLERGLRYLGHFLLSFVSPVLLLPGLWLAARRGHKGLALAALVLAVWTYGALVGGCHMPMGRFLVPSFALGALALALLLQRLSARSPWPAAALALLGIAVAGLPGWNLHLLPQSLRAPLHFRWNIPSYITEHEVWREEVAFTDTLSETGRALKAHTQPGESIVLGAIGAVAWYSGLDVHDRYGLVSPEVARRDTTGERLRSPGHDKWVDIWWFLPQRPTILYANILVGSELTQAVRPYAQDLHRHEANDRYVPALVPLEPGPGGVPRTLLMLRAIPDGVDPARAWRDAQEQALRLDGAKTPRL